MFQPDESGPIDRCGHDGCRQGGSPLASCVVSRLLPLASPSSCTSDAGFPQGDLTRTIDIEVEGEMATLKETVNSMVAQLTTFAREVTRVALEVGTFGQLGGQAIVEGVEGTWADLTTNVNVSRV